MAFFCPEFVCHYPPLAAECSVHAGGVYSVVHEWIHPAAPCQPRRGSLTLPQHPSHEMLFGTPACLFVRGTREPRAACLQRSELRDLSPVFAAFACCLRARLAPQFRLPSARFAGGVAPSALSPRVLRPAASPLSLSPTMSGPGPPPHDGGLVLADRCLRRDGSHDRGDQYHPHDGR